MCTSSSDEHVGVYQLLWRVPDVLHQPTEPVALGGLVDRVDPGLPDLLHRHLRRPHHRRGLLPPRPGLRHLLLDPWHLHHIGRHDLLAAAAISGHVHGPRLGPFLHARHLGRVDLL